MNTRWRVAAPLTPLIVLGTGGFAVVVPEPSAPVLGLLAACVAALVAWGLALVLTPGWRQPAMRAAYGAAVVGCFAAFGVLLAWRTLGGGGDLLARLAALFVAAVLAGVLVHDRVLPGLAARAGGPAWGRVAGASAVTLGLALLLLVRLAPLWFAQHLLLPAMLLVALVAGVGARGGVFR